ncbi:hypothetical protein JCM10212_005960 [Sporobolomyces blumeae]
MPPSIDSISSEPATRFRTATSSPVQDSDEKDLADLQSAAPTVVDLAIGYADNAKLSSDDGDSADKGPAEDKDEAANADTKERKGARFYLVFLAICCSIFLSALDLTSVSTALPAIAAEFETSEYSWVGSSYTLASTALIPWTGGFAYIFGRRPVMVASILIFALGSALTGAARNVPMLIAGRTVQGIGGGGIQTLCAILVVDLVPIAERGPYFGLMAAVWALASSIGPPVGGALASAGQWRWLFYLNLPICGIAVCFVLAFLRVKTPKTTAREKLQQMDWFNLLFVASATSLILGLTWGGVSYAWSSYQVLVPLVLGLAGVVAFVYVERYSKHPTVPFDILTHYTSVAGYVVCFLHSLLVLSVLYFFPVYLQSVVGDNATQSGVHSLSLSFTIAPMAMLTGFSVAKTGHYKTQTVIGLALVMVGMGLMTLLTGHSSKGEWVGFPIVVGLGAGMLYSSTNFAVLAPLKPSQQPFASAFFGLIRAFGQVCGISVGSSVLQNRLNKTLPSDVVANLGGGGGAGGGGEIAFAAIPLIKNLPEPVRSQVREAFADSTRTIWQVMIGVAGLALVVALTFKSIPLSKEKDEAWGLADDEAEKKSDGVKA